VSEIPKEDIRAIAKLETLMDTVMKTLEEISIEQKELRRENAEIKAEVIKLKATINTSKSASSHVLAKIFANNWIRIVAMFGGFSACLDVLYRFLKAIH